MIVRELITKLGWDFNPKPIDDFDRRLKKTRRLAINFLGLFSAGMAVREIRQIADEMQSLRARMAQTPQQTGNVADSFDELAAHAIKARSAIGSYADFYTRVSFAAKDYLKTQEDVLRVTDTVSKALVVGGTSGAERSAVLNQLSQALGSNRLGGDEYRSLREAAPQLVSAMADALGKTRGELDQMAEKSQLTTKVVIGAIEKMGDAFDERFKKIPLRISDAGQYVYSKFSLMIDRLNRKSMFVTKIANGIVSAFDKFEAAVYSTSRAISDLVKDMGGWDRVLRFVKSALYAIIAMKTASMIIAIASAVFKAETAFKALSAVLMRLPMFAAFAAFVLLIEDFIAWTQGKKSVLGSLFGDWAMFKEQAVSDLQPLFEIIKSLIAAIGDLITLDFAGAFHNLSEAFDAAVQEMKAGIREVADYWYDQMPQWAQDVLSGAATIGNFAASGINGMNKAAQDAGMAVNRAFGGTAYDQRDPASDASRSGGGRSINQTVTSSVNLQVPYGTPDEQTNFLRDQADRIFESKWQREMDHAAGEFAGGR